MTALITIGFILAIINPVIGGVLVGYIVWLKDPNIGFQIILLALTMMQLLIIVGFVYLTKKIKKLEKQIKEQ
ncbi:hypothetical protein ACFL1U_00360 [Patescibacteria group bacterium]